LFLHSHCELYESNCTMYIDFEVLHKQVARFKVGETTIEVSSGQDLNSANTSNSNIDGSQRNNNIEEWKRKRFFKEHERLADDSRYTAHEHMAFQAGLNVPGGSWSDTKTTSATTSNPQTSHISPDDIRHKAGQPIIMNTDTIIYILFLVFDVIACGLSISIIILLLYKKHPEHMHRFVKIRLLLVYNMSMIALAYIVGCAYIAKSAIPDEEALIQTEQGLHIDYIRRDAELKVRASGNTMWCMQTASN
jgi:Domain of unknown function